MPAEIRDEAFEFLLARAGLKLTDEQKAELKAVYAGIAEWRSACASRAAIWPSRRMSMTLPRRISHERRDPDDCRSRPGDRGKAALAGRTDARLS